MARHSFYSQSHSPDRVRDLTAAAYESILVDPLFSSRHAARHAADGVSSLHTVKDLITNDDKFQAFIQVLECVTDEGVIINDLIETAWKSSKRPGTAEESVKLFGKLASWQTTYISSLNSIMAKGVRATDNECKTLNAAEKIVRAAPPWLIDSLGKETSPRFFLETITSLHVALEKASDLRDLDYRSKYIGDPKAQIYASGLKITFPGSKSKSHEFPRIVLGMLLENHLIDHFRQHLLETHPPILRLRENMRYALSYGVKETTIVLGTKYPGVEVPANWYFFSDGLSIDTAPKQSRSSIFTSEERTSYKGVQTTTQPDQNPASSKDTQAAEATTMIKVALEAAVSSLGNPADGIPRSIVNAAQLLYTVSPFQLK